MEIYIFSNFINTPSFNNLLNTIDHARITREMEKRNETNENEVCTFNCYAHESKRFLNASNMNSPSCLLDE